jgi:hypothetical protein
VTSDAGPGSSPAPRLPFDLPESKPQRRVIRPGITRRSGVLAWIEAAGPVPVIAVVAPAGYGMATLLAQCAERKGSRAAWISCGCGRQRPGRGCPNGLLAGSGRGRAEPDEGDRPECRRPPSSSTASKGARTGDVTPPHGVRPFSHLALIEAAGRVILAGRIEELGS